MGAGVWQGLGGAVSKVADDLGDKLKTERLQKYQSQESALGRTQQKEQFDITTGQKQQTIDIAKGNAEINATQQAKAIELIDQNLEIGAMSLSDARSLNDLKVKISEADPTDGALLEGLSDQMFAHLGKEKKSPFEFIKLEDEYGADTLVKANVKTGESGIADYSGGEDSGFTEGQLYTDPDSGEQRLYKNGEFVEVGSDGKVASDISSAQPTQAPAPQKGLSIAEQSVLPPGGGVTASNETPASGYKARVPKAHTSIADSLAEIGGSIKSGIKDKQLGVALDFVNSSLDEGFLPTIATEHDAKKIQLAIDSGNLSEEKVKALTELLNSASQEDKGSFSRYLNNQDQ